MAETIVENPKRPWVVGRRGFVSLAAGMAVAALLPREANALPAGYWDTEEWAPHFPKTSQLTGRPLLRFEDDPEGIISAYGAEIGVDVLRQVCRLGESKREQARLDNSQGSSGDCWGAAGLITLEQQPIGSGRFSLKAKTLLGILKHMANPMIPVSSAGKDGNPIDPFDGAIVELSRPVPNLVVGALNAATELGVTGGIWNVRLFLERGNLYRSAFGFPARPVERGQLEAAYIARHWAADDPNWLYLNPGIAKRTEEIRSTVTIDDGGINKLLFDK